MTELVTCRVCGLASPLGTPECPDCGAPLPQELPKPPKAAEAEAEPPAEAVQEKREKKELPPRVRWARRVGLFVALALAVQLTAVLWPQKPTPPGIFGGSGMAVTPEGVWDFEKEGFYIYDITDDRFYWLLRKPGEEAVRRVDLVSGALSYDSSSSLFSYAYAPNGDYYLFDGMTLEHTDWDFAVFGGSKTVFYTQTDDTETTLFHRDLTTGKVSKLQRFEGAGKLSGFTAAPDGSAAAYYWLAGETLDPGAQTQKDYRLWRRKDGKTVSLGDVDYVFVGNGGESCLLYYAERTVWIWGDSAGSGTARGNGGRSGYYLWRDGETVELKDMQIMSYNKEITQLLLWEDREDYAGDWYFLDADAGAQPQRLGVSGVRYLSTLSSLEDGGWTVPDRLNGQFYYAHLNTGGSSIHYLDHRGDLVNTRAVPDSAVLTDSAGQAAIYLEDDDLCRLSVHPDDTVELTKLTHTNETIGEAYGYGRVSAFAADKRLEHIYYMAREVASGGMSLHYRHGDEDTKVMEWERNYGVVPMAVTEDGGCYVTVGRSVYYTKNGDPPTMLLEETGALFATPEQVGEGRWTVLTEARYENGTNQAVYWYLDGTNEPVELTEWTPEEGKI